MLAQHCSSGNTTVELLVKASLVQNIFNDIEHIEKPLLN